MSVMLTLVRKAPAAPASAPLRRQPSTPTSTTTRPCRRYRTRPPREKVLQLDGGFPSDGDLSPLPRGTRGGYRVVRNYSVPENGFDIDVDFDSSLRDASASDEEESSAPSASRRRRLEGLAGDNVTLPIALTLLDPRRYPTLTRARKACRRGSVLVHRGPIPIPLHADFGGTGTGTGTIARALLLPPDALLSDRCRRGRTDDRVHPGDVVGIQFNLGMYRRKRCYPNIAYGRPKFYLPVVYEDDHIAVVNKPAGIGVYWGGGGGGGGGGGEKKSRKRGRGASRRTVRDALPHVLTPPARGTVGGALRRPSAVHRLDVPTSGLLVVAKTRSAMVALCRQFEARTVRKTYTSVVNGVVPESRPWEGRVVPGDGDGDGHGRGRPPSSSAWSVVDYPLGGKSAVTEYRTVRRARSLNARDGTLSLVNLRPHTGRYHQLRRHMAWMCRRPMVGDALYAGLLQAPHFRRRGLYLCSDGVTLDHPYYNTPEGRREWDRMDEDKDGDEHRGGAIRLSDDGTMVQVSVSVELPKRFEKLLDGEEEWARMCTGTNVG